MAAEFGGIDGRYAALITEQMRDPLVTEDRSATRMHPDDLAALQRAMLEGPARVPSPPPSEVPSGVDARLIREVVSDIVGRQTALFVPGDEIRRIVREERKAAREEYEETLRNIGLRVDPEHIEETGNSLRTVLKWQRRFEIAGNTVIAGMLLSGVYAVLKWAGVKGLPSPPGMGG